MNNVYHNNDTVFLYVKFICDNLVENAKFKIVHKDSNNVIEDVQWTKMEQMGNNEFYYNYQINNFINGEYQIIYIGDNENTQLHSSEKIYIVNKGLNFNNEYDSNYNVDSNIIKIYGYVYDNKLNIPIPDCDVMVIDDNNIITQSSTDYAGKWENYIYPGEYKIIFKKQNFESKELVLEINNSNSELQLDNINLSFDLNNNRGTGIYTIEDYYISKDGSPICNLYVNAFDINNPTEKIAYDITNEEGKWMLFLNDGNYLLKIYGNYNGYEYNSTLRLKVGSDGEFSFDNLSNNVIDYNYNENLITNGCGDIVVEDIVLNSNNQPIVDVQVNAFIKGKALEEKNIIAQTYTDLDGKWQLNLKEGKYIIEYYHPYFQTITEEREVKTNEICSKECK